MLDGSGDPMPNLPSTLCPMGSGGLRSAWIKWARAVELQAVLARATREYAALDTYEYIQTDNAGARDDPLFRAHWKLKIKHPHPERWSVLIGDVLTNFRAALDHAFWYAVHAHSGPPVKPWLVDFPITSTATAFEKKGRSGLAALVSTEVWGAVEKWQPFNINELAYFHPLAILQWLSNVDKHRAVHVVGSVTVDMGPIQVDASSPVEVVEEWHLDGPVQDGQVVARIKLKRPPHGRYVVDLRPTFARSMAVQIAEDPGVMPVDLDEIMADLQESVLRVLGSLSDALGLPAPDPESFERGLEHEAFAAEFGGVRVNRHPLQES